MSQEKPTPKDPVPSDARNETMPEALKPVKETEIIVDALAWKASMHQEAMAASKAKYQAVEPRERPAGFAKLPKETEDQRIRRVLAQFPDTKKIEMLKELMAKETVPPQVRFRLQQLEIFHSIFDEALAQIEDPKTFMGKKVLWSQKLGIPKMYKALGVKSITDLQQEFRTEIESFLEHEVPKIEQELLAGKTTMEQIIRKHPLLQRLVKKYDLRFSDPKNEEDMLSQENQLLSYFRGAANYDKAAGLVEGALQEEFAVVEKTIPKERKEEIKYEAVVSNAELVQRHREQWRSPSKEHRALGVKPLTEQEISEKSLVLQKEKERFLMNAEIAKRFDPSRLKGAKKQMWEQYNEMLDPKGEYFNISDAHFDMILEEVAINAPLIIASGGVASVVRAGAMKGMSVAARSMAGRLFAKEAFIEGAKLTTRQAIAGGMKKTAVWAGGTLVEGAAFEAVHSALLGEMPKDLPEWGERILWSSATLGLFHGAGKIGERVTQTAILKRSFAKITSEPARKAAELLLVKGHIEAAAMMLMGAVQNGVTHGNLDEFYENFGEELLHAYVTVGALKIGHASVETITGKVFKPEGKKALAEKDGETSDLPVEKSTTDNDAKVLNVQSAFKQEQSPLRMDEARSAEFLAKERSDSNWKKITTNPKAARLQVFEVGNHKFSVFWLKYSKFIENSEGIPKSLTGKCVRSALGTPEHAALEKAEVLLAEAFHEAKEFLGGKNQSTGFYIEGSQAFGMEQGNLFGIRVSSARTDILLQKIMEGNAASIREVQDFLRAEFVHEMVHHARDEALSLSYQARDEVASHAIQFLALEGQNAIFNRQMQNGIEAGSSSKNHYDVAQTAALKLIFQECTALAKSSLCLAPDSYAPEALKQSIASIPQNQRSQILKDMTQRILSIDGNTLLMRANNTPDLFSLGVNEAKVGDVLMLGNELLPSGESIAAGKYSVAEKEGALVISGEHGETHAMPLLKGSSVFVRGQGVSARGAIIPEGRYTFSYNLDEFSEKRTPVLIPEDGGAPYTIDFTKITLEPELKKSAEVSKPEGKEFPATKEGVITREELGKLKEKIAQDPALLKEYLKENDVDDPTRIELAETILKRSLNANERQAILNAHKKPGAIDALSESELRAKVEELSKGISEPDERRLLIEAGICGWPKWLGGKGKVASEDTRRKSEPLREVKKDPQQLLQNAIARAPVNDKPVLEALLRHFEKNPETAWEAVTLDAGPLITEGRKTEYAYIILAAPEGSVRIFLSVQGQNVCVRKVDFPCLIGEMSALGSGNASASVHIAGSAEGKRSSSSDPKISVLRISQSDFKGILSDPGVEAAVSAQAQQRSQGLQDTAMIASDIIEQARQRDSLLKNFESQSVGTSLNVRSMLENVQSPKKSKRNPSDDRFILTGLQKNPQTNTAEIISEVFHVEYQWNRRNLRLEIDVYWETKDGDRRKVLDCSFKDDGAICSVGKADMQGVDNAGFYSIILGQLVRGTTRVESLITEPGTIEFLQDHSLAPSVGPALLMANSKVAAARNGHISTVEGSRNPAVLTTQGISMSSYPVDDVAYGILRATADILRARKDGTTQGLKAKWGLAEPELVRELKELVRIYGNQHLPKDDAARQCVEELYQEVRELSEEGNLAINELPR